MTQTVIAPLVIAISMAVSLTVWAQTLTPAQLPNARSIAVRSRSSTGMPAVNYDLMLQEMLKKTPGKVNQLLYWQLLYWSRPLDWRNQTLTPNPDAIYFMAFFNTKDVGPIVLDVPAAGDDGTLNGNIVDVWQMPLEDAGPPGRTRARAASI